MKKEKYPEGHFIGIWTAIFIFIFSVVGIPISIVTDNSAFIGIGPAIGVAVGLSIGSAVEEKYKKEGKIRQLNKKEEKRKKIIMLLLGFLLLLGIFLMIFLFK